MGAITIIKVETKKDLDKFILLLWKIYEKDVAWVPPLLITYKKTFERKENPFFLYGNMELYIAQRNGETVGRIAAVKNNLHNDFHKDNLGFFGFFECINDQEVANALFNTVKKNLRTWGFTGMRGPASPSSNGDYGVQISGFEYDPVILTPHNRPYYHNLCRKHGMKDIMDLFAFRMEGNNILKNGKLARVAESLRIRTGIKIRCINMKNYSKELLRFKSLYNRCWEYNHGFVPLTDEEFRYVAEDLKAIIEPSICLFAEIEGKIVAGTIVLPDYNFIFKQMNGSLWPFNFLKMFTQKKKIKCVRVTILGVLPEYRKKGIEAILYYEIVDRAMKLGATWAEASYILETNTMMIRGLEGLGADIYKTYKVMEMDI